MRPIKSKISFSGFSVIIPQSTSNIMNINNSLTLFYDLISEMIKAHLNLGSISRIQPFLYQLNVFSVHSLYLKYSLTLLGI